MTDIKDIEFNESDLGFNLVLGDRSLAFSAADEADFEKWQAAVVKQRSASSRVEAQAGPPNVQDESPSMSQKPEKGMAEPFSSTSVASTAAPQPKKLDDAVQESKMVVLQDGSEDPAYVVLKADGFYIYADQESRENGEEPHASILKRDVIDLEILET